MLSLNKVQAGVNGLALLDRDVREPGPGEMLLKVHAAGVCGTDMQIYGGSGAFAQRVKFPTILGHEMCGTVVQVGRDAGTVKVGDVVSLESHIPCWTCRACRTGRAHVCTHTRYPGIDIDGTFAEYVTVPASIAWVNPADVSKEKAALLEPLGIAVHATLEGSGVAGQTVVVNGCGPIGLMNVAVARHFGARLVVAVDPNPKRRQAALRMGADRAVDPIAESPVDAVRDMTRGDGADVVFEYTGSHDGVRNCFAMVGALGEVRWCATPGKPMEFDFGAWRRGRPTIYNIHGRRLWQTWEAAAPLVYENKIDLEPVISHQIPLAEAPRAFELILAGEAVKPLILC
ncbi:MAG: alcohol dehydrogenase catalytic domain-containing protein [Pigmentiphaga sp.]|uniref:alcohol dehydrogenase catalytic domain-containing protein n=1 Tax=Pigmentiphaga sp. TaxID=1977564 RepID=UPI0029A47796|nr:alcohol dehydrogenase catalytic domain-containing protein [Pigmentiphaga sp.]MDX3906350.1 alcohol dehydrogenase catalytic domain-containing protein [Pigmentiphaga sp.]